MTSGPVMAAKAWPTNGHLIADVARLGYIGDRVLDLSFGKGVFWREFQPLELVTNDFDMEIDAAVQADVREPLPTEWAEAFDTVVWDGSYRYLGRPDRPMDANYGTNVYLNPKAIDQVLCDGVDAAIWCTKPGGTILTKSQNQTVSGAKRWQTEGLVHHGWKRGLTLVDRFEFIGKYRKQPTDGIPGAQKTSRSINSQLLVWSKGKRTKFSTPRS